MILGLKNFLIRNWERLAFYTVVLLLIGSIINCEFNNNKDSRALLDQIEITNKEIVVERNKTKTLNELLLTKDSEYKDLLEVIKSLEVAPERIKYVTRTESILVPGEPVFITNDLPQSYLFDMQNGLVVAQFRAGPPYEFLTHELTFKTEIAIADNKTSALTKVKSDYDDTWFEVSTALESTAIDKQRFKTFDPDLHLGVSINSKIEPSASLALNAFHVNESIDMLSPKINIGENIYFGINPISYKPNLPLVDDLWVSPGAAIGIDGSKVIDLTISTQL
jgi:hypothetical protein